MVSSCQAQEEKAAAPPQTLPVLTAADMRGPDGLIYPNFTFAGVSGGIPNRPVKARLSEFGGKVETDIADALENGAVAVEKLGGGALLLEAGTYYLDRPILITADNVVIRGAGRDATKIVFRWEPPKDGVTILGAAEGDTIPANRGLTAAAWNDSKDNVNTNTLKRVTLEINGEVAGEQKQRESNDGPWFAVTPDNRIIGRMMKPGANVIRASAEWVGGRTAEKIIKVNVSADANLISAASIATAITFTEPGAGRMEYSKGDLAQLPRRGDSFLQFKEPQAFQTGDYIQIYWPGGGWKGHPIHIVKAVEGNRVHLKEPIRITMDTVSNVRKIWMIRGSGVEDLTLTQTGNHWTNLLDFSRDAGCWVRNVRLVEAGRFPLAGGTKNFEMRDSLVEGVRFHFGVGGGTGYLGFTGGQDNLMDNVQSKRLRHAPNLQNGASGTVIRNSVFEDSDMQFHRDANWDNLLENNVVHSRGGNKSYGSYGAAFVATTATEGDLGARNVIWNNDFTSAYLYKDGAAINLSGGAMKGWIIAYNRFVHDMGYVLKSETTGLDVMLKDNVFSVRDPEATVFKGDVSGLKLTGNRFYNFKPGTLGSAVALDEKNRFEAANAAPERPRPPVPSLFEWQKQQVATAGK
jgi:hypothetical protein